MQLRHRKAALGLADRRKRLPVCTGHHIGLLFNPGPRGHLCGRLLAGRGRGRGVRPPGHHGLAILSLGAGSVALEMGSDRHGGGPDEYHQHGGFRVSDESACRPADQYRRVPWPR